MEITSVRLDAVIAEEDYFGFMLGWETESHGFGTLFVKNKCGKIIIENEYMKKETIKAFFEYLIDNAEFEDYGALS